MKACILAAALLAAPAAMAQDANGAQFAATTLSLSADGVVRAAPDLAVIDVGVTTSAPRAADAIARNRSKMSAVVTALRVQGIAAADIQTSALELNAQYFDDQGRAPRKLTGYETHNTVTVRVHDLPKIGTVVDALVGAGANQVDDLQFKIEDTRALEDEARRAAVQALAAKADLYARATGYRIKRLVRLSEGGAMYQPLARMSMALALPAQPAPTPVSPGELTVRISVNGEYELTR